MTVLWERQTKLTLLLQGNQDFDLAEGALDLASLEYPHLDVSSYLKKLGEMSKEISPYLHSSMNLENQLKIVNRFFFDKWKFRGNKKDYYNPKNSFLNDVIDYKTGIPISLSVLYLTISWKLGLPLYGVSLPGHFLVGCKKEKNNFFVDVFNKGKTLSQIECVQVFENEFGSKSPFYPSYLQPVTNKQILCRMIHNLKGIYLLKKDFMKAMMMLTHILLLSDNLVPELKQRGLLALSLECYQLALNDFKKIRRLAPDDADTPFIQDQIEWLKEKVEHIV